MNSFRPISIFLTTFLFCLLLSFGYSTSYTWTGATNHNWNTTTNWTPNGTPGSSDNVTLNSSGNSPILQNNVTVTNLTITGGTFDCHGDTITVNGASSFGTCTITNGILKLRSSSNTFGATTVDIPVDAVVGTIQFNGATFNKKVTVEVTSTSASTSNGGNTFNDTLIIYRSNVGNGTVTLANSTANTYNKLVTLRNVGTGGLQTTGTGRSKFNENIVIECSGAGGINIGTVSGGDTLASGKTITIGSNGFTAGTLVLRNFVQVGSTAQSLTLSATTFNMIGCTFNGNVVFSANALLCKQTVFNGKANLTNSNTSNTTVTCDGGNTFNAPATINQLGTGSSNRYRFGVTLNDAFNDSLVLYCASGGELRPAYGDTTTVAGHVVYNGFVSTGYSGGGVLRFAGSNAQNFTVNNHLVYHMYIDKTANDVTLLGHMTILTAGSLNFNSGKLICTSSNYITMASGSTTSGAKNTSFVSGPIEKTGNTSFVFPIGKGNKYMPLEMTSFTATNTWDDFTAEYYNTSQSLGYAKDTIIRYISGCDYWRLARTNNTPNARIKLAFDSSACSLADSASLRIANWNGTKWKNSGNGGITGTRYVGMVSDSATITNTQFTNYYALSNSQCFLAANAGTDKSLCAGDSVTIGASPVASRGTGTTTYTWSPSTALSSTSLANPTASPTSTTSYIVTLNDALGCSIKDTLTVNYHALPTANAGIDTSFCSGDSISIGGSPTASGGGSPYTYSWNPSTGLSSTTAANPITSTTTSTSYVLTVTDNYGCLKKDTVNVFNNSTNYTWTGATSTDWSTSTNWSPNGIPGRCDNVFISANVWLSTNVEVNRLTLSSAILSFSNNLIAHGKTIINSGNLTGGNFYIDNNDSVFFSNSSINCNISATGLKFFLTGNTFYNTVDLTQTGNQDANFGGNVFNGIFILENTGNGNIYFAMSAPDIFNAEVDILNNVSGNIYPSYSNNTVFKGNVNLISPYKKILFGSNGGKTIFSGSGQQAIVLGSTSATADTMITFSKIQIDKPVGDLKLEFPIRVTDTLYLTKGIISSDTTNLLIMNAGSVVTGATDTSFVNGPVKKVGNTAFVFPTGKGSSYRAIEISAPSATNDAFTAEYFDAGQTFGNTKDSVINYVSECNYWHLGRDQGSSDVLVKLYWDTLNCGAFELDSLHLVRWDGTLWKDEGNGGISGNYQKGNVRSLVAQNSFGYFSLGYKLNPLIDFAFVRDTNFVGTPIIFINKSKGFPPTTKFIWNFGESCGEDQSLQYSSLPIIKNGFLCNDTIVGKGNAYHTYSEFKSMFYVTLSAMDTKTTDHLIYDTIYLYKDNTLEHNPSPPIRNVLISSDGVYKVREF